MAKITAKAKTNPPKRIRTINRAGGEAFTLTDKERLATGVLTSFFGEANYYGDTTNELIELAFGADPKFVAQLAVYARNNMNLRTFPVALTGVLCLKGQKYARSVINQVCTRPDQLCELVSFVNLYGENVARSLRQMKLGLSDRLNDCNEYALSKYSGTGKVKLKDVLKLCHAKPKDKAQSKLFKKLLSDTLETPVTWETVVSEKGNNANSWEKLWRENALGYMAALRNLRNMIEAGAECVPEVLAMLQDLDRIKKSKQLPFRFYSAYREMGNLGVKGQAAMVALNECIELSVDNLSWSESGSTLVAADVSGSMDNPISGYSGVMMFDISSLLTACVHRLSEGKATLSAFSDNFALINVHPRTPLFEVVERIRQSMPHGGTYAHKILQHCMTNQPNLDRIIILTDEQCYNESGMSDSFAKLWEAYRYQSKCWLHIINLKSYGTTMVQRDKRVNYISGWSERVLEYIAKVEGGEKSMLSEIESIKV